VGVCRHDLQYILQCIDDELETIKERKKEIRKDTTRTDDQKILDKKECDKGLRLFKKLQKFAEPLVATAKRAPAKKKTTAKAPVKTRVKLTTAKPAQKTAPKKPSRRPRGKTKVNTLPI